MKITPTPYPGTKEFPLVDFEIDPDHEWAAALYESYAADSEGNDLYAVTAMVQAEELDAAFRATAQCDRDFF